MLEPGLPAGEAGTFGNGTSDDKIASSFERRCDMELSILIAKILSLTYLAAAIAAISGKLTFSEMIKDFETSPALTFIAGFVTLILGMILVTYHNLWVRDWRILVTVVGWMALIKGIVLIAFPKFILTFRGWYQNSRLWGFLMLAAGLLFGYFGFLG